MPSDRTHAPGSEPTGAGSATTPPNAQPNAQPNGPDYGSAPPFNQALPPFGTPPFGGMGFGGPYSGMPGFGMPPFPMPFQPGYPQPGYGGHVYPVMDTMMSQMIDRAAFLHRLMITMSNMAAEMSRACQLLAQNPSQIGMPMPGPMPGPMSGSMGATPAAGTPGGDSPVDIAKLKQALEGMDKEQAQKTLYAVQMMQYCTNMMRGGQPPSTAPGAGWS